MISSTRGWRYLCRTAALALSLVLGGCTTDRSTAEGPGPDTLEVVEFVPADTVAVESDTLLRGPIAPINTWTIGRVYEQTPSPTGTLRSVRTARHDSFDRIIFEFGQGRLPTVEVEYVDRPVRDCTTGEPIELQGDAYLRIRFTPARARDAAGSPTVTDRERQLNLGNALRLTQTCDAEGVLEWLVDVRSPEAFRVTRLSAPARYALDVIALNPPPEQ
ncbi:hypothetical protein BH23BAC4_BH23BAC4_04240 [soil metagenome]